MPDPSGTLVAEATPPGRGGLRVLRLSGPGAGAILAALFRAEGGEAPWDHPRRLCFGRFLDGEGREVDRGLAVLFAAPRSFTGEEVAELHCHGSGAVVAALTAACMAHGARPALPGEFSFRAFLNGKLTLPEAEALDALTAAQTALQAEASAAAAGIAPRLRVLRQGLLEVMADWEARLDFPEDAPALAAHERSDALAVIRAKLESLLELSAASRPLREGWRVALCGAPNVGKSSIFNALLNRERALVTPHPGTTRDVLEETLDLGGLPVVLLDTAGLRESLDPVEALGVARARAAAAEADGALLLYDRSTGWGAAEEDLLAALAGRLVAVVASKSDLPEGGSPPPAAGVVLPVSSVTGEGLGALVDHLRAWASRTLPEGSPLLLSARQRAGLGRALSACGSAQAELAKGVSEEVALQSLREARRALDELLGEDSDPEALYDELFSRFCIGK